MSLAPFPSTDPYGKSDWRDYVDNWRELDAEWIQARTILRYEDASKRNTDLSAAPGIGRVTYNLQTDRLELFSKTNAWLTINPLPVNLKVVTDDLTAVALAHSAAIPADRGITIGKDDVRITHVFRTQDGVLVADTTGLAIKTGGKTAKLTTDGTATVGNLISDTPISMPSIVFTGTGNVINTTLPIAVGALTAASGTVNGPLQVNGALTATGASTIGGVAMAGGAVTAATGSTGGFYAGSGAFYGDVNGAVVRYRNPAGGAYGATYMQVWSDRIEVTGGPMNIRTGMTVSDTTIGYFSGGVFRGNYAPHLYGGADLLASVPEGTIWIQ